jgi:predicted metal-dependent enzyme (double-stranded beta helix superfamily)
MFLSPSDDAYIATNEIPGSSDVLVSEHLSIVMRQLIAAIGESLGPIVDEPSALALLPPLLERHLADPRLLEPTQRIFDANNYNRHLLHADEGGRFTVLALTWLPGQVTPVHGHNAWGVVGIHDGIMENTCYHIADHVVQETTSVHTAAVGHVARVESGDGSAHSLRNPGSARAITIHVYGMDLAAEPTGLNRYYDNVSLSV